MGEHIAKQDAQNVRNSNAEKILRNFFDYYNLNYIFQKKFDDCKNIRSLSFDFFTEDYNILWETQGKQHYEPVEWFGGMKQFKEQQKKDQIKKNYCKNNNIKLIEIPYWDFNNIEEILTKELNLQERR